MSAKAVARGAKKLAQPARALLLVAGVSACAAGVAREPTASSPPRIERRGGDAQQTAAAIVGVAATRVIKATPGTLLWRFFREQARRRGKGAGTGTIVRQYVTHGSGVLLGRGMVLTSFQVVRLASTVKVTLANGQHSAASLAGADPRSGVAILRLHEYVGAMPGVRMGDSRRLRLGDRVVALAFASDRGPHATTGVISTRGAFAPEAPEYDDLIESDVLMRPGAVGGALVNAAGEVVGINSALATMAGGSRLTLSVPSAVFVPIVERLVQRGAARAAWFGARLQRPSDAARRALGSWPQAAGEISAVTADSPAARAGLHVGDVITAFGGRLVGGNAWLRARLVAAGPGATVDVRLLRRSCREGTKAPKTTCALEPMRLTVTLAKTPRRTPDVRRIELCEGQLGGVTLSQQHVGGPTELLALPTRSNVSGPLAPPPRPRTELVVSELVPRGPAQVRLGLRVGDRIVARDGEPIASLAQFVRRYRTTPGPTVLTVLRGAHVNVVIVIQ